MNLFALLWQMRVPEAVARRQRRRGILGKCFLVERLEDRIVLSVSIAQIPVITVPGSGSAGQPVTGLDTTTPTPIPIGDVQAGQIVKLDVDYMTTDPDDQFEGEPLIITGSNGTSQTISTYGNQIIDFPITEDDETLFAYVQGADGDEGATISVMSGMAQILINNTATNSDNITLLNPASSALPAVQTIPAMITNPSDTSQTYQLSVQQTGSGDVSLSQSAVSLAPGESTEVTVTPTADSSSPNDVHIIALDDGTQVAEDDMTVVEAFFPKAIYNADTPAQMVGSGYYRIPPRVATPTQVTISPDLAGSGQSVTVVAGLPSPADGTFTIDGNASENLTSSGPINLTGGTQTTPGNSGKLSLMLYVDGEYTVQSSGFSVAAIPVNYTETFVSAVTEANFNDGNGTVPARGLIVQDGWTSDSGVLSDLDQVQLSEVVQYQPGTGAYISPGSNHNSAYLPATEFTTDTHANALAGLVGAVAAHGTSGAQESLQTNVFEDARTGASGIPMTNSGYTVTRTIYASAGVVYIKTDKAGADVTANGVSSAAGAGSATVTQVLENLPPGDPLAVTTQPPATIIAGQAFGLVVTAENSDGTVNTLFDGAVTVASADGSPLHGTLTVNAVAGVATFSGLTETVADTDALDVTAAGLPMIATSSFTVQAAPATQLTFLVPPTSGAIAGVPFAVEVAAEDPYGNVDPNFNGSVTVSLAANPNGATLGGTLTGNAINGLATFNGVTINPAADGFLMQATAAGLTTAISSPFDVTDQLVVTTEPPSTVTMGAPFGLAVSAENGQGQVDTSFGVSVTLTDNDGNTLGGPLTITAVNGVAVFSGLTLNVAGPDSLTVTATGFASASTAPFNVAVGQAVKIVIAGPNGTGAGNVIASPFSLDVYAEDANGNVATNYNGTVTISLLNDPGNSTLGGTLTTTIVNGDGGFDGLTINNPGNGYTLQAASSGLTSGVSVPFDVTTQALVTTQPPATLAAGTPFGLIVSAEAGLSSVDTSYTGNITLALSNYGTNSAAIAGMLTEPAINGVATFSGLTISQAGSYGLVVTGDGLAASATNEFVVRNNTAARLAVTAFPSALTAGAGFAVNIAAEDSSGNIDTNFTGNVSLALDDDPGGAALGGTVTVAAVGGIASFTGLTINNPASGYSLQATAAGLSPATSAAFAVTPAGVANQLVFTTQPPASITAGSPIASVSVWAEDASGTVDKSYDGTVTLAFAADAVGSTLGGTLSVQAVNGIATFTGLTVDQAAGGYILSASSPSLVAAASSAFAVTPAAATHLAVIGPMENVLAGGTFKLQVAAEDPFGNVNSTFAGSAALALASNSSGALLSGALTITAVDGVANFSDLAINNAGTGFILKATHGGLTVGTSSPFNVTADQLVITTQPPASVAASAGFGLVVAAENASGNIDASFNGSVTLALVSFQSNMAEAGGLLTVTAVNGVATFSGLSVNQSGNYSLSAAAAAVAATAANPFVVTAVATQLVVTSEPPPLVAAGSGFSVTIAAEDSSGNIDSAFNGPVTLSLAANPAGGVLGGMLSATAVDGVAVFSGLSLNNPGNGYTLTASSSGLTATTTNAIGVAAAGMATQLVITAAPPASITAGDSFGLTIAAEDPSGNVASSFDGTVTLVLDNYSANPFSMLGGALTVTAINGVATFSGLSLTSAGTYSLSASSNDLTGVMTGPVTITPQAATQLAVAPPTGNVLTGAPFTITVNAQDASGNIDPAFTGVITLSLAGNPANSLLGGILTATAIDGVATFTGLTINNPDPGYTLKAAASGLAAATSVPFTVSNDQFVVLTQPPASVTPGAGFGLVVAAEDGAGDIDTSFNGSATVSLPADFSKTIGGPVTVSIIDGVATFSGLALDGPGYFALTAASNGIAPATTDYIDVAPVATQLVLTGNPPAIITAGAPFGFQVSATDAAGNVDATFDGAVTLTLAANPGGVQLGGTLTVTAVNGIASFTGLTLPDSGAGYYLQAAASGLTAVTTPAIDVTPRGVATQLVITTNPPAGVASGAGFGMVVKAEDSFGTVDTAFDGALTLADPSGPVPGGTLTVNAVDGVATFGGLTLVQAGDYLLSVSASGLPTVTAPLLTVTGAPATSLTIVGAANVLPNSPFSLTVLAVDFNGNIDPTFTGPVTLALANNPGGAQLGGTLTADAASGMATFSGLTLGAAASGYSLAATSGSLTASSTFDVTTDQLMLTTPPPNSIPAGSPFGLVVSAVNSSGNVDTSFNGQVTLTQISNAPGAVIPVALLMATAVHGVATFTGLSIGTAGSFSFSIASSGVGGTNTNTINVTAAVPAPSVAVPSLGRVVLPLSVLVGDPFRARLPVVITNDGAKLSGKFTITVYADLGTTLDGNQVEVATLSRKLSLKAGKTSSFNFSLRSLPRTLQKGTYHLLVLVTDPTGATNLASTTQTVQLAAANIVLSLSQQPVTPSTIALGKTGLLTITVTNTGTAVADGVLQLTLSPSSDGVHPISAMTLAALSRPVRIGIGKSMTVKLHFRVTKASPAGTFFAYLSATLEGVMQTNVGASQFTLK